MWVKYNGVLYNVSFAVSLTVEQDSGSYYVRGNFPSASQTPLLAGPFTTSDDALAKAEEIAGGVVS